jgi:cysteinyl-tRNA synthetase
MALKLYNSLTRRKEEFESLRSGFVGVYVCGPTVYDHAHMGHARSYVAFDVIVRYLRFLGYRVRYVQNLTDVGHLLDSGEDRMLIGARREKIEPMELAERYIQSYFEDMDRLNILRPNISPRASAHIPEQIELIKTLLAKGYAYEVEGSVYFEVKKFPNYGKLSGRSVSEQLPGARISVHPDKRAPADFALWIRAEPEHLMRWPSPWGWGYPGWHLECSAMAMKYLGETLDIHGGGRDNQFPHHECEIAQSEAATGKEFVRYWLHNGMVMTGGAEMHKSLGNFFVLKEAFKRYRPEVLRFYLLTTNYRSPLDFSLEGIEAAASALARLQETASSVLEQLKSAPTGKPNAEFLSQLAQYRSRFLEAMDDDFNTASALAVTFDLNRWVSETRSQLFEPELKALSALYFELCDQILGIKVFPERDPLIEGFLELLVSIRDELRKARQYELADRIRSRLERLGIILEDGPDKTRFRYKLS